MFIIVLFYARLKRLLANKYKINHHPNNADLCVRVCVSMFVYLSGRHTLIGKT